MADPKLSQVPAVDIDGEGTFKYILCKVFVGNNTNAFKMIVRGTASAEFHNNIYDPLKAALTKEGISCEVTGGGKIKHDPHEHTLQVFGKSQGYGKADHAVTASILKETYPAYSITLAD